jgi:hypothetical protein
MAAEKRFLIVILILLLAALLGGIFSPKTSKVFLNHRRAVESIRELNAAEHEYATLHSDFGFACELSELGEQGVGPPVGLIDRVLASGTKSWYHFEIRCFQIGSEKAAAYIITAVPTMPGTTGVYAFCADQRGEIWYSEDGSTSDCLAKHKPIERKYR